MALQLVPKRIVRLATVADGFPLEVEELAAVAEAGEGWSAPADEVVRVEFGGGFANVGRVVDVLRAIATELQSNNGFSPDMEEVVE